MVNVDLKLSEEVYRALVMIADACSLAHQRRKTTTTHGPLDVAALLTMLAEDAAFLHSRPGGWEAANMAILLASHGYEVE
ncbi:hypothetical protein BTHE68_71360 (plasmid) [Burkholderia sp. THE68]|uniref:hypothetical protein n=1 Tax=Burkholderia sp. THE68 TaxID=758782 RepID=UPI001316CCB6|nr:hypothetical protein [Burkholderia sp. THE68]BBU33402.1 hypothetical protein BTHE68_71360 [Burkholderia sp. THE68]